MKIVILGDPHFGLRNNSKYFMRKQLEFYSDVLFPFIEVNNIKELIILGDTFDNRKTIDINTINIFNKEFFKRLESLNVNTNIIIGNHDIYFKNSTEVNSVKYLQDQFTNIKVIDFIEDIVIDNIKFGFCSWITEESKEAFYNYVKQSTAQFLIGHFEISGFEMTAGHPCEDGISVNIFDKFENVISGHFHVRNKKSNIEYVSTQIQMNWGDYGLEKGFGVFDTETKLISYINNQKNIFEKIAFDSSIDILNFNYDYYYDKIVRIYIRQTDFKKNKKFDLFVDKLSSVVHRYDVITLENESEESVLLEIEEDTDTSKLIKKYIDSLDIQKKDVIKNILTELFVEAQAKINNDLL